MVALIVCFQVVVLEDTRQCVSYTVHFPLCMIFVGVEPNCQTIYRMFTRSYVVGVCRESEMGAEVHCGLAVILRVSGLETPRDTTNMLYCVLAVKQY